MSKKILGNARLTFDEMRTILVEVESTINCRPLTYEYNETDEEVLTPSHWIYVEGKGNLILETRACRDHSSGIFVTHCIYIRMRWEEICNVLTLRN